MNRLQMTCAAVVVTAATLTAVPAAAPAGGSGAVAQAADERAGAHGGSSGIDVREGGSAAFAEVVRAVQDRFPDDYSDAAFATPADGGPWVSFRGTAPAAARQVLDALEPGVRVVEDQGLSAAERALAVEAAAGALGDSGDAIVEMLPLSTTLRVTTAAAGDPAGTASAVEDAVREALGELRSSRVQVDVRRSDADLVAPEALPGGTALG